MVRAPVTTGLGLATKYAFSRSARTKGVLDALRVTMEAFTLAVRSAFQALKTAGDTDPAELGWHLALTHMINGLPGSRQTGHLYPR